MKQTAFLLIITGIIILSIGLFLFFFNKIKFIGKLPGDILIEKENFTFYFPITTSILLSVIISAIIYFLKK